MKLCCESCGKEITVPHSDLQAPFPSGSDAANAATAAKLMCHLNENESQRTEITSYINQLNIQLHRWQLRLQTLNDRNAELKAEIASLAAPSEPLRQ